ncbi:hypothetical protein FDI26_gp53 [Arthrobacter phage Beans]|uniref:Uncharacterized protein n=1 Tax=Arthrobacter phage Beans TaxID=2015815 RepID=A0A222ZJ37_9CAUD|nr:hypothetical protein FDI26_gp53 [Arthrobacter phage Beans]ASR84727.1 hypothetical protein SEA_BEANS_53 [Arthrobacter phage Beans]
MKFTTVEFDRIERSTLGQGKTVEYRDAVSTELIAYIDYNEDGKQAAVQLSVPGGTMRGTARYSTRPKANAEGIVARHLRKQGYTEPAEHADRPIDNEIEDRALQTAFQLNGARRRSPNDDGVVTITARVEFDGSVIFSAHTDGRGVLEVKLDGHEFTRQAELTRAARWAISDANIASIDAEIKRLDEMEQVDDDVIDVEIVEDDDDIEVLPDICPRCGINKLDRVRPAMNARSRYAPVYICSPCGRHEALTPGGVDLWHDPEHALRAIRLRDEANNTIMRGRIPEDSFAARVMTDAERKVGDIVRATQGDLLTRQDSELVTYKAPQWPDSVQL